MYMDHSLFICILFIMGQLYLPVYAAAHAKIAFQMLRITGRRFDAHTPIPDTPDDLHRLIVARCEVHGMAFARLRLNRTSQMRRDT